MPTVFVDLGANLSGNTDAYRISANNDSAEMNTAYTTRNNYHDNSGVWFADWRLFYDKLKEERSYDELFEDADWTL